MILNTVYSIFQNNDLNEMMRNHGLNTILYCYLKYIESIEYMNQTKRVEYEMLMLSAKSLLYIILIKNIIKRKKT